IEQLNHTERYGYVYDALGRRIEKHRLDRDGKPCNRTTFLWDGLQMIQESSADKRQSLYLYTDEGSYEPLARIDRNGNQQEHIYYFHTDLNGMPEELTDEAGEIVWECSYQLWGKPIQEIAHTEIQQNLRYQGQYLDRETGLHYNTFRYYDLDIGRFTQPDPIGLLGGLNLYQYAPNGLTWIDPWGLTTEKIKLDPNEILVNPKDVNFSQKTINSAFDTPEGKRNIQSVINDVRKGNVKVTDFPAIRVVDVKGQLVVRDGNSRLAIARSAKAKQIKIVIETNVNELKDFKRRLWRNNMPNTGTSKVPTCK
ncbi:RHS repeat domain-containing protein, partial [Snodgrassella alvi]|uniref:RHS repeat domain-containing protein n=1 Tax=Snodgrassella alvi TaxID=1196083 RepID=UPI0015552272